MLIIIIISVNSMSVLVGGGVTLQLASSIYREWCLDVVPGPLIDIMIGICTIDRFYNGRQFVETWSTLYRGPIPAGER